MELKELKELRELRTLLRRGRKGCGGKDGDSREVSGRKVAANGFLHGMELVVPWYGEGSSMPWRKWFAGTSRYVRRHLLQNSPPSLISPHEYCH